MSASLFSRFGKISVNLSSNIGKCIECQRQHFIRTLHVTSRISCHNADTFPPTDPPTRDIEEAFLDERVQTILHQITGLDIKKVMHPRQLPMKPPKYLLLTDEQLKEIQDDATARAAEKLQMPPVLKACEPIDEILSQDPDLKGLNKHNILFTDITFGISDRDRYILVREPGGTLRKASWEERQRCLQIYFPHDGRKLRMPKMFEEQNLEDVLNEERYEYVLDRASIQFEPDDPLYIRVIGRTYTHIDTNKKYDVLRSTRHFGGMAFYLAWHRKVDYLMADMLQRDFFKDAVQLVHLHIILHPDSETANDVIYQKVKSPMDLIKTYIAKDAPHKGELELALQSYEEEHSQDIESQ
ncbi:small ribosomal subunit protein mS22-like [Lineus longissimus]|uniref:small ribosomal subunit protein mS22-like n=1 Tax=Lineus longissimus TaxID=88925 RepID=UPI002B4EA06D